MNIRKKRLDLSDREQSVMSVLWESGQDLTNNEIAELVTAGGTAMSVPSVSQVTKKLLARDLIRVKNLKQTGTVYARTFEPVIRKEVYLQAELERIRKVMSPDSFQGTAGIFRMLLVQGANKKWNQDEKRQLREILKAANEELAG